MAYSFQQQQEQGGAERTSAQGSKRDAAAAWHACLTEDLSTSAGVLPAAVPSLGSLWDQLLLQLRRKQQQQSTQQAGLCRARARYLSKAWLLQELTRLSTAAAASGQQSAALVELARRVQVASAVQRLELPGGTAGTAPGDAAGNGASKAGSHSHWFGVTPQDLLNTCDLSPGATQEVQRAAAPLVEAALLSQHASLQATLRPPGSSQQGASTAHGEAGDEGDGGAGGQQASCSGVASRRLAGARARRARVMLALLEEQRLSARLLDALLRVSHKLQGFSEREVAQWQQQQSQFAADLAGEHTRSLCHKVSHVETQVLSHMYTPADCQALAKVHAQLAARSEELDKQLHQVRSQVVAYEALGPPFQALVSTYGRLRAELRAAQQALSTFTELESELEMRDVA